jgi:hypothetical protein
MVTINVEVVHLAWIERKSIQVKIRLALEMQALFIEKK